MPETSMKRALTLGTSFGLLLALASPVLAQGAPAGAAAEEEDAAILDRVIVTGTRETGRTEFESLAPVDVFSGTQIEGSASAEFGDVLAQLVPSFSVQRLPLADGQVFVRPASLRNLSPDQTLVLINGKRLHRSALLGSRGSQAPDFGQIPSSAIKRVEVLRDGASALYGSDAIAGVINVILKDEPGLEGFAQYGSYYEGDGVNYRVGGQGGLRLGEAGFLAGGAEWSSSDPTSRTRQRPDAITFQAANPALIVPNPVQRWGQPELEALRANLNFAYDLTPAIGAYGFATYGQGEGDSDFNWRNPSATGSVFNASTAFPGFSARSIYPVGFSPLFGQEDEDYQLSAGLRGDAGDLLTWDLSASYGANQIDYRIANTINASLGPASPLEFNLGSLAQREFNLNADFVYKLALSGLENPLNIAFGAERRLETYEITAGEPASYAIGPGAATGLAPNANGFPGFSPRQAGENDQTSNAAYLDVEADITPRLTLAGAVRYEDFSEFGSTTDYKASARFALLDNLAARASYSTGFRAPTPGQQFSTATTQGLDTVTLQIFNSGRLSPSDPLAVALGAQPLKPEEAETLSAGLTWRTGFGLSGSIDAYQIEVRDRFSQSATRAVPAGTPNPDLFTGVSFFVNAFDTKTTGIDLTLDYQADLGAGRLDLTGAVNLNETEVEGGTTSLVTNAQQRRVFEEGRPQRGGAASASYQLGKFNLTTRARYYGNWTDSSGNTTGLIFQEFGAITLVDLALTYDLTDKISARIGAENIFDTYPDEATFQSNRGLIYSRNAPYDTDGGQYYIRLDAKF